MAFAAEQKRFYFLTTRVLSGEASAAEQQEHRDLLERPEWHQIFIELQRRWDAASTPPANRFDLAAAWARLSKQLTPTEMAAQSRRGATADQKSSRRRRRPNA